MLYCDLAISLVDKYIESVEEETEILLFKS